MNLTRFEPWSLVDLMYRDLDRVATRRLGAANGEQSVADWVPAVDIVEETERFVLRADVPGVDPKNIDVSMDSGVLTVAGERRNEAETVEDGVKRIERFSGRFYRRFTLPETADAESISARSENGILEVSIPKQPEVRARRITVEHNA